MKKIKKNYQNLVVLFSMLPSIVIEILFYVFTTLTGLIVYYIGSNLIEGIALVIVLLCIDSVFLLAIVEQQKDNWPMFL